MLSLNAVMVAGTRSLQTLERFHKEMLMAGRRVWFAAGGAIGAAALLFWGLFPWGRAADVVPSTAVVPVSAPAEENFSVDGGGTQKYAAGRAARSQPLRDPFRVRMPKPEENPPPLSAAREKVVPETGRRAPDAGPAGAAVLRGTLILGGDRRAVIEWNRQVVTVREGEQVGPWQVTAITRKEVTLSGPGGATVLSL